MLLPPLAPLYGTSALFLSLAAFSLATLLMLPFLSAHPATARDPESAEESPPMQWRPLIMTLLAIFVFQAANMGLLAYIIRLGIGYGLEREYVSTALGLATWVALLGPALVMICGLKFGRFWLLFASMILTLFGTAVFHWSASPAAYMTAEFDKAGRASAFGGFISKMGLASGPLIAGWILGAGLGLSTLINTALAGLALSMVIMLFPARHLDSHRDRVLAQ